MRIMHINVTFGISLYIYNYFLLFVVLIQMYYLHLIILNRGLLKKLFIHIFKYNFIVFIIIN